MKNIVLFFQVKWSSYKKVPIVVAELKNGRVIQLNDSTFIVSVLKSLLQVTLQLLQNQDEEVLRPNSNPVEIQE